MKNKIDGFLLTIILFFLLFLSLMVGFWIYEEQTEKKKFEERMERRITSPSIK